MKVLAAALKGITNTEERQSPVRSDAVLQSHYPISNCEDKAWTVVEFEIISSH